MSRPKRKGGLWLFWPKASKWRRWRNIWRHSRECQTSGSDVSAKQCNIHFLRYWHKSNKSFYSIWILKCASQKNSKITISPLFAWASSYNLNWVGTICSYIVCSVPVKKALEYSRLTPSSPHFHCPSLTWLTIKNATVRAAHTSVIIIRNLKR